MRHMQDDLLDHKDISLLHVLTRDSRGNDQQISDLSGLSIEEVGERIEVMVQAGVVRTFTTKPSLASLGAMSVMLFGPSRISHFDRLRERVSKDDRVAWLAHSTGGRIYLALHLRGLAEQEEAVSKVVDAAELIDPVIARRELFDPMRRSYPYGSADMRLINSLSTDSRRPLEEVAREVGEPLDLVEGRLHNMLQRSALDFSIDLDLNVVSNPACLFHLKVRRLVDLEGTVARLMREHAPSFLFFNTYSNHPDLITSMAILDDFEHMRRVFRSLQQEDAFSYVEANPLLHSLTLPTWRDKMLAERGTPTRKKTGRKK